MTKSAKLGFVLGTNKNYFLPTQITAVNISIMTK
jgi:hypothetical protein